MDPDYAGALTLMVVPGTPLHDRMQKGEFILPGRFELLAELFVMLRATKMSAGLFTSNHASNYVPLRVRMPGDTQAALAALRRIIDAQDETMLKPEVLRAL